MPAAGPGKNSRNWPRKKTASRSWPAKSSGRCSARESPTKCGACWSSCAALPPAETGVPTDLAPTNLAPTDIAPAEIERLLDQLDDDSFADRVGAEQRLNWLLGNPAAGVRIMTALKARLKTDLGADHAEAGQPGTEPATGVADDSGFTNEDRQPLVALLNEVRGRWLTSPTEWPLPPIDEKQWRSWIADLIAESDDEDARVRRAIAERELRDLLARKEYAQPVAEAIRQHRDEMALTIASQAVERLLAWIHPAMVAEVWADHRHVTIQYLLVDVPQFPEGGWRATHFDRIDEHTAHCVSGNNLEPGDYPVGLAIPHPHGQYFVPPPTGHSLMFHLINLPTPRERMAYKYRARRPQADRLRELSERTMAAIVAEKRRPTQADLSMLAQLDPETFSRSIGAYFDAVPDQPVRIIDRYPPALTTEHELLCAVLADVGTHHAIPALEKEAGHREQLEGAPPAVFPVAWTAVLAIAERDPWDGIDAWLAGLISREVPLAQAAGAVPDLGATAAFLLLRRHEQSPRAFGLIETDSDLLNASGVTGYRFRQPADRDAVLRWWSNLRQPPAELGALEDRPRGALRSVPHRRRIRRRPAPPEPRPPSRPRSWPWPACRRSGPRMRLCPPVGCDPGRAPSSFRPGRRRPAPPMAASPTAATSEPTTGIGTPTISPTTPPTSEPASARIAPRRLPPAWLTPRAPATNSTTSPNSARATRPPTAGQPIANRESPGTSQA